MPFGCSEPLFRSIRGADLELGVAIVLAVFAAELPNAIGTAEDGKSDKDPQNDAGPFVQGRGQEPDHVSAVGGSEPAYQPVAKDAPGAEGEQESAPGDSQRAGGQQEGPQRDGRRKNSR